MARRKNGRDVHGIFLLDKPYGMSSNAALQKIKRVFGANKAGHTGALDPLATGMLPICFGEATKFSHYLLESDKRYRVTATLGIRTDTSDAEGQIIQTRPVTTTLTQLNEKLTQFRGQQQQIPTLFSALKYQGKPLYDYARKGIDVPRQARQIEVYELIVVRFDGHEVEFDITCSKGTYIRTLIDDLGEQLGCGAHVSALRRLHVAHFKDTPMYTLSDMETTARAPEELESLLLPLDHAIQDLPCITLTAEHATYFKQGRPVPYADFLSHLCVRIYIRNEAESQCIGLAEYRDGQLYPKRVLVL